MGNSISSPSRRRYPQRVRLGDDFSYMERRQRQRRRRSRRKSSNNNKNNNNVAPRDYDPHSFQNPSSQDGDASVPVEKVSFTRPNMMYQDSEKGGAERPPGWLSPSRVSVAMGSSLPSTSSHPSSGLPRPPPPPPPPPAAPPLVRPSSFCDKLWSCRCWNAVSSDHSEYTPVMDQSQRQLQQARQRRRRCLVGTALCSFLVVLLIGALRGRSGSIRDNASNPGKVAPPRMEARPPWMGSAPNDDNKHNNDTMEEEDLAPTSSPTLWPAAGDDEKEQEEENNVTEATTASPTLSPADDDDDDDSSLGPGSLEPISPSVMATAMPTAASTFLLSTVAPTAAPSDKPPTCPVCVGPTLIDDDRTKSAMARPNARLYPDSGNFMTCHGLTFQIDNLVTTSSNPDAMCLEYQVTAAIRCGCETYPHPRSYCRLCPDGSLPPPHVLNRQTPIVASADDTLNLTCADLIWSAAVFESNQEPACSTVIVPQWAKYCDCPGFGGDGPEFDLFEQDTLPPLPSPVPTLAPTTFSSSSPSSSPCTLCADGSAVVEEFQNAPIGVATVGDNYKEYTCGEGELDIATFHTAQDTECGLFQLLGQAYCGCPEVLPLATTSSQEDRNIGFASCSLCPNGEVPPRVTANTTAIVGANDNDDDSTNLVYCFELHLQATQQKRTSRTCRRFQQKYGAACGCSPAASKTTLSVPTREHSLP